MHLDISIISSINVCMKNYSLSPLIILQEPSSVSLSMHFLFLVLQDQYQSISNTIIFIAFYSLKRF